MPSMSPLQGHRALRRGRVSLHNQAYLVTAVCQNREPVFADVGAAEMLTTLISSNATWPHATVHAWVLMPDHWHGLIVLSGNESLSRVMQRLKGLITQRVHAAIGGDRPVWQSGFHDHALRSEESVAGVARYILDNPVRAGLVEHWSDRRFRGGVLVESLERTDPFDL